MPQQHFFTTEQCEKNNHDECAGAYSGMGLIANCICSCHEEKERLLTPQSKAAERGRQSKLEEFGESNDNKSNRPR